MANHNGLSGPQLVHTSVPSAGTTAAGGPPGAAALGVEDLAGDLTIAAHLLTEAFAKAQLPAQVGQRFAISTSRISPEVERRLLAAADRMNCAAHGFVGKQLHDTIIGTLETGCRLGELARLRNWHVLWDEHCIVVPQHLGGPEGRRIPFEPEGRLGRLLKERRATGLPDRFVFGSAGYYSGVRTLRNAWGSLIRLTSTVGMEERARGEVDREQPGDLDLRWDDLRYEAAFRWFARGMDSRTIEGLLGCGARFCVCWVTATTAMLQISEG